MAFPREWCSVLFCCSPLSSSSSPVYFWCWGCSQEVLSLRNIWPTGPGSSVLKPSDILGLSVLGATWATLVVIGYIIVLGINQHTRLTELSLWLPYFIFFLGARDQTWDLTPVWQVLYCWARTLSSKASFLCRTELALLHIQGFESHIWIMENWSDFWGWASVFHFCSDPGRMTGLCCVETGSLTVKINATLYFLFLYFLKVFVFITYFELNHS